MDNTTVPRDRYGHTDTTRRADIPDRGPSLCAYPMNCWSISGTLRAGSGRVHSATWLGERSETRNEAVLGDNDAARSTGGASRMPCLLLPNEKHKSWAHNGGRFGRAKAATKRHERTGWVGWCLPSELHQHALCNDRSARIVRTA
ncbi:unnamed protein product [Lota lota]